MEEFKVVLSDAGYDSQMIDLPLIQSAHTNVAITTELLHGKYPTLVLNLPCATSRLLWLPWPKDLDRPKISDGAYHNVNFGKSITMPRRTKCYSHTYSFSGQTHPVEASTPTEITKLYEKTNEIFRVSVNMCLENQYEHGRHYISKHSDDERQFSDELRDVFCWSLGAPRRAVFALIENKKGGVLSELSHLCQPNGNPVVLDITLPEGLYVMQGSKFQKTYTHEFPQQHPKLFEKLVKSIKHPEFPQSSPDITLSLLQAAWIKNNPEETRRLIREKKIAIRGKSVRQLETDFAEWCRARTSFTLRQFK